MRCKFYQTAYGPKYSDGRRKAAFTLVEVLISMTVIVLFTGALFAALTQINRYAESCRTNTAATALVIAQLDKALSVRNFAALSNSVFYGDPFDDTRNVYGSGTSALTGVSGSAMIAHTLGSATTSTVNIFMNSDLLASGSTAAASAVVTGTMTTLVNEASILTGNTVANPSSTGTSALRRVNVQLKYQYRGNPFTVQMTGFRAPDK